uniref:Chemokine interleukin-8-like domain-containing protein n=1 Tax=Pundamilia nyererei TaxID=303518 RepID=A0A3B4F4Q4_9CICH
MKTSVDLKWAGTDAALSNPCFSVTAKKVNTPDSCCFRFFDKRIPKANIVSIVKTHRQCPTPAFETKRSRKLFVYVNIYKENITKHKKKKVSNMLLLDG